jgi:hypothetical protein
MTHNTREDWLTDATAQLRPIFDLIGKPLPKRIRVATGHPLNFKRNRRLGDCHAAGDSADKSIEICVSPTVAKAAGRVHRLLSQLCRATAGHCHMALHTPPLRLKWVLSQPTPQRWTHGKPARAMPNSPSCTVTWSRVWVTTHTRHWVLLIPAHKAQGCSKLIAQRAPPTNQALTPCRLTSKWAAMGLPSCPLDNTVFTLETI